MSVLLTFDLCWCSLGHSPDALKANAAKKLQSDQESEGQRKKVTVSYDGIDDICTKGVRASTYSKCAHIKFADTVLSNVASFIQCESHGLPLCRQ